MHCGYFGMGCIWEGSSGFPWALFAFCCCFGIADECWQDWLDRSRVADVWDVASDAAGAFIIVIHGFLEAVMIPINERASSWQPWIEINKNALLWTIMKRIEKNYPLRIDQRCPRRIGRCWFFNRRFQPFVLRILAIPTKEGENQAVGCVLVLCKPLVS